MNLSYLSLNSSELLSLSPRLRPVGSCPVCAKYYFCLSLFYCCRIFLLSSREIPACCTTYLTCPDVCTYFSAESGSSSMLRTLTGIFGIFWSDSFFPEIVISWHKPTVCVMPCSLVVLLFVAMNVSKGLVLSVEVNWWTCLKPPLYDPPWTPTRFWMSLFADKSCDSSLFSKIVNVFPFSFCDGSFSTRSPSFCSTSRASLMSVKSRSRALSLVLTS